MTGRTTTAAFFDLDKTLIPGSSLFLFARGLYDHDFYRAGDLARFGWEQAKFRTVGAEWPRMKRRAASRARLIDSDDSAPTVRNFACSQPKRARSPAR